MSKKDYISIASMIYRLRSRGELNPLAVEVRTETLRDVANELSDIFRADNSLFDRSRFLEACETGTTKGMPKVAKR